MQSLPSGTVDFIWSRLAVRWGVDFVRQYEGLDLGLVKEDWARELARFMVIVDGKPTAPAIMHALANLPDRPVTVGAFRAICLTYRAPSPRMVSRKPQPVPAAVADYVARLHAAAPKHAEPERVRVARRFVAIHGARSNLNPHQRQTLAEYQRVLEQHARMQQGAGAAAGKGAHG